jgi:two-component system LytT family sensor kinase
MRIPALLSLRTNRNVLFWSLHAAGWAAYGITQYFGALLYEKPASYARVIAASAIAGFLLSMPMRYIYQRLWNRPPRTMILGVLATCYITALALRFVINLSYKAFIEPDWQARTLFEFFGGALSTTYLLLCWSVLYFGIKFYESQRKQEEALLKAVALAQEAQLKMLRYQLNPHFLFNTLNAISTLILDNQNKKANYAVARLSEFLRYTLDQDPMKKVTLRQELEAPAPGIRGGGVGHERPGAEPAAAAALGELAQVRRLQSRAGRPGAHRGSYPRGLAGTGGHR